MPFGGEALWEYLFHSPTCPLRIEILVQCIKRRVSFNGGVLELSGQKIDNLSCLMLARSVAEVRLMVSGGASFTGWPIMPHGAEVDIIQCMLELGGDANQTDVEGWPLLCSILSRERPGRGKYTDEEVQNLVANILEHNADVNLPNAMGQTPLHIAITAKRSPSIVQLLLQAGADPNVKDPKMASTSLATAIVSHDISNLAGITQLDAIISHLLEHGADPNIMNGSRHRSPLHILVTCGAGMQSVATRLLSAGANPDVLDDYGMAPIHFVSVCDAEIVPMLLQGSTRFRRQAELYLQVFTVHTPMGRIMQRRGMRQMGLEMFYDAHMITL